MAVDTGLSQSRACGDYLLVALDDWTPFIDHREIARLQGVQPIGGGFEIVEQGDGFNSQLLGHHPRVHNPRKIGGFADTVNHRCGDSESGAIQFRSGDELLDHSLQVWKLAAMPSL